MSEHPIKNYPTIGCCGLDCGLCPRYYTVGSSKCPGCCGPDFFNKHPSCSFITCCVKKKGLEACGQCGEFPCKNFESWLETGGEYDSFLTHKKARFNLVFIRTHSLEEFIEQQKRRLELLGRMLKNFDDGKSRSFYCVAVTLLPITDLETSLEKAERELKTNKSDLDNPRMKSKILREFLNKAAASSGVDLRLRRRAKANDKQ